MPGTKSIFKNVLQNIARVMENVCVCVCDGGRGGGGSTKLFSKY